MTTIFVNKNATGNNDGSSWDNAFTDLQDAIAIAAANDEIWVAEGTYKPTTGTRRSTSFEIPSAVGIYGGFAGGETSREQRDWLNNITILSGDIGQEGLTTDNSSSVVDISGTTPTTILDGFTISDGKNDRGRGAGVVAGGNANATLRNLVIRDNTARGGAGLFSFGGNITLINVSFIDNFSEGRGGAIYTAVGGVVNIENGLFIGNEAQTGGAIYSIANVTNSTFYNNQAAEGGAIYLSSNSGATTTIENTIVWNNSISDTENQIVDTGRSSTIIVNNSIVEGGYNGPGTNIIDAAPLFFDPNNNDLRLRRTSPGVDAGNNNVVEETTDIVNNPRIFNSTVDLGAYEYGVFMSINDVSIAEGNSGTTNAEFTVTLRDSLGEATAEEVTVNYKTVDGTATAGSDYTTTEGTLTFFPGDTNKIIRVPILGDELIENNERFSVELSGLTGTASIADGRGLATITNDDLPREITIADATFEEGNEGENNIEFTLSLNQAYIEDITVNYSLIEDTAIPNQDYTDVNGTVTFAPGETQQTIPVVINGDTTIEADETFFVQLSNPSDNATLIDDRALGTITNDDFPQVNLSISPNSGSEADGTTFTITANTDNPVVGEQKVDLLLTGTANQDDFGGSLPTSITIADGAINGSVTVNVIDDGILEEEERAIFTISNPTAGLTLGNTTQVSATIDQNINLGDEGGNFDFSDDTNNLDITAGSGDDTINTGSGNNTINAGAGNNIINAGAGDDVIVGSGQADIDNQIDGGEGTDTVIYDGTFDSFPVRRLTSNTVQVGNNTDILTNVERLQFTDQTVAVEDLEITPPLDDSFIRFRNENVFGTYLFTGEEEARAIRDNFSPPFTQEGEAFKVSLEEIDGLVKFNRFRNNFISGTYIFASEEESVSIRENFSDAFTEEGTAFYAYGADANLGEDVFRFRNTNNNTYLFALGEEANSIRENFSNVFVQEGVAFEVEI